MSVKNLKELKEKLNSSEEMKNRLLENPEKFIQDLPDPRNDKQVFLIVLYVISGILVITILFMGYLVLISQDKSGANIPQFLITISSTALGALVGLLVPNSNN